VRVIRALVTGGLLGCAALTQGCARDKQPDHDPAVVADHAGAVQEWRTKHEADYRREYVTIAGLHDLLPGTRTVGSDPASGIVLARVPPRIGRLAVADGRVTFEPEPGAGVLQGGRAITAPIVLKEPGAPAAEELSIGDVRLVVHTSGDRLMLRVRDPQGTPAAAFAGFDWFPVDIAYRVGARLIRDPEPRPFRVLTTLNDLASFDSEGVVEFQLQGRTLRLRPFTTRPNRFYFVFRDASAGGETYKVARFLYSDLLPDGTTVLDFNEAYNPPCAFNPYTTCPIPLDENVLPVKIPAGERAYRGEAVFD
jgi:uncharacterized protein (DUF1684 family)